EAQDAARRQFGGVALLKEDLRERRGFPGVDIVMRDIRYAFRAMRRNPIFTATAIVTLALGIGANTAIFTLTNQILLRVLPVKDPAQLVLFEWRGQFIGGTSRGGNSAFAYPMYKDLRDGNPGVFTGIAARYHEGVDVSDRGPAQRAAAELVSGNYFQVLGVTPALGRMLAPGDDRIKNGEPYVVLSYDFWQRRFGGDPSALNRVIDVNGHPMTIVGVAERGFTGFELMSPADLFVTMSMKDAITPTWDDMNRRDSIWLRIFARRKTGVPVKAAQAAIQVPYHDALASDLKNARGRGFARDRGFTQKYLKDSLVLIDASKGLTEYTSELAKPFSILLAMVGVLLLIACVNVANLLITRASSRQKEIAVRLSLGATRGALIRLIMTESFCIAAASGALALVLSTWLCSIFVKTVPLDNSVVAIPTTPDWRIFGFTAALSFCTALLFGLLPAFQATRPNLAPALKNEAGTISSGGSQTQLRRWLVAVQVALSLLLLTGAGLFARSLHKLMTTDTGMNVDHVLTFSIDPSLHKYTPESARRLFLDFPEKLEHIPGVLSASAAVEPVLANETWQNTVHIEGHQPRPGEDMNPGFNAMLPGFFSTMSVPLIAGRDFNDRDIAGAPKVAIVNETFVKRFFPHRNPLGMRFGWGDQGPLEFTIVGVVRDMKGGGDLREEVKPWTYTAALQEEKPSELDFYVRTRRDPLAVGRDIHRALRSLDPALPLIKLKTLEQQIDQTQFVDRLIAWLTSAFGLLATLLASIGLYGVTAFSVARRTREIGIRMALGARRGDVIRLVTREVLLLSAIGIAAGIALALALGKLVESQLYEIKGRDPMVMTAATVVILVVAALASYIPARRATRIDPTQALRYE
ncbi:MAG TPA: ABC transporter permease, partial [Bryobacteraceae bacterium]|nr:ABC transporter permease [Bryobacteraceae bacterium]